MKWFILIQILGMYLKIVWRVLILNDYEDEKLFLYNFFYYVPQRVHSCWNTSNWNLPSTKLNLTVLIRIKYPEEGIIRSRKVGSCLKENLLPINSLIKRKQLRQVCSLCYGYRSGYENDTIIRYLPLQNKQSIIWLKLYVTVGYSAYF